MIVFSCRPLGPKNFWGIFLEKTCSIVTLEKTYSGGQKEGAFYMLGSLKLKCFNEERQKMTGILFQKLVSTLLFIFLHCNRALSELLKILIKTYLHVVFLGMVDRRQRSLVMAFPTG